MNDFWSFRSRIYAASVQAALGLGLGLGLGVGLGLRIGFRVRVKNAFLYIAFCATRKNSRLSCSGTRFNRLGAYPLGLFSPGTFFWSAHAFAHERTTGKSKALNNRVSTSY